MPYKFNPFTGNFDEVESGGSGGSPGGTSGQLQFNDGGSFSGVANSSVDVDGNVTLRTATVNAPSGYTGNLLDLQRDGTSKVAITTDGKVGIGTTAPAANLDIGPTGTASSIRLSGQNDPIILDNTSATDKWFVGSESLSAGIRQTSNGTIDFVTGGNANRVSITNGGFIQLKLFDGPTQAFRFGYSGNKSNFGRLSENRVGLSGGTQGQTFEVYNTYTSSTNYERAKIEWDSNTLRIGTEKGSAGGTARDMELQTDGTTRITVKSDGAILFSGLPTSDPVVANQLWNDGGTLKISAG